MELQLKSKNHNCYGENVKEESFWEQFKRLAQRSPHLIRYIYNVIVKDQPIWAKLIFGLILAYVIFPFDLIPDFLAGIGWWDDLLLILMGLGIIGQKIPENI